MFGTLNIQPKEELTFVENTDLAATLSRNQRYRPHVSCNLCRARKTRCSGEPSGCDRCVASSAECRYPEREVRRKRKNQQTQYDDYGTNSNPDGAICDGRPSGAETCAKNSLIKDNGTGGGHGRIGSTGGLIQELDMDPAMFPIHRQHNDADQRHVEQWLSSNMDPNSYPGSALDHYHLDNASGIGHFLDLPSEALYDTMPGVSGVHGDGVQGNSLEGTDSYSDVNDRNADFSSGRYHLPAAPVESAMGPLIMALASPRQQACDTSRGSSQQDLVGYGNPGPGSRPGDWSGRPQPTAHRRGQRSTASGERRKTQASKSSTRQRRDTGRDPPSSSSFASNKPPEKPWCRCCMHLVCLLEELAAKRATEESTSMYMLFGVLRNAIAQCKEAVRCQRCHGTGKTGTQLAIVCQYISALYVTVVKCCVVMLEDMVAGRHPEPPQKQQRPQPGQHSGFNPGQAAWAVLSSTNRGSGSGVSNSRRNDADADMWYSTYRIESSCEKMHVLMTLVTVQISEFSDLLASLKSRIYSGTNQMTILSEAMSQTAMARRTLRSSIDRRVGVQGARYMIEFDRVHYFRTCSLAHFIAHSMARSVTFTSAFFRGGW